jgi:quercetin dioxygenase-like cupin family protein
MLARNFYDMELKAGVSHDGRGMAKSAVVFNRESFDTGLRFIIYTALDPGVAIGNHRHGDDEEIYMVLEGEGLMTVNGEQRPVKRGDVLVNKPHSTHGLENNSNGVIKLIVFEVVK